MEEDAQQGISLLHFKTLQTKRKSLKLAEKKSHTQNWKSIGNHPSQKATLEVRTYWNKVFNILKGNCF